MKDKRENKCERKRERERIEEVSFSLPFTSFRRSELDRPGVKVALRVALRDESYAWVPQSQDVAKAQGSGFFGNQENVVSREIMLFEVGFSPTRFNFCLRACVCVRPREVLFRFSLRPHDNVLALTGPSLIRIE